MNNVNIMGRICNDIELKTTMGGVDVVNFTVAVPKSKDETNFIRCVAFNKTAVLINTYFGKGRMIAVNGSIDVSNYADKNGQKRESVNVVANSVYFCGDKSQQTNAETPPATNINISGEEADEALPF